MINKTPKLVKKGDIIFSEGQESSAMYIVKEGAVGIKRNDNTHIVSFKKDEFFGEMGFFDKLPRSATAYAETDSYVWEITTEEFETQLKTLPIWCVKFFKILSARIRDTNQKVQKLEDLLRKNNPA